MDQTSVKEKYKKLFKELVNEINQVLKDKHEFSIIIIKKQNVQGLIVKDSDLSERHIHNCELDETSERTENIYECGHYNTLALSSDISVSDRCNTEPNCK